MRTSSSTTEPCLVSTRLGCEDHVRSLFTSSDTLFLEQILSQEDSTMRCLSRRNGTLTISIVLGCCIIFLMNQPIHQLLTGNTVVGTHVDPEASSKIGKAHSNRVSIVQDVEKADLYGKVRVLCWILTSPDNHKTKALAVKETWGKRCNVLLFMSSEADPALPSVKLPVREGRNQLWGKTREAFRHIWNHYRDEADWFLKADDDTYVVVENLRYFLSPYNTSKALWFGHKYKAIVKTGYFSGGAGYALSKEATRLFVEEGYFNALACRHDHEGAEDAEMGKCMQNLNVSAMDTRDSKGRGRFFPFVPEQHYFAGKITPSYWYWNNIYYAPTQGRECCSDSAISFHYVNPQQMYIYDYFLYQLRPFGMQADQRPSTPEPPPDLNLTAFPWFAPKEETTTITLSATNTTTADINFSNVTDVPSVSNFTEATVNKPGAVNKWKAVFG